MRRYSVAATINPRVCAFLVFAIYQMQLSITITTFSSNCAMLRKMDDDSTLSIAMNNGSMPLHGLDKNVFVFYGFGKGVSVSGGVPRNVGEPAASFLLSTILGYGRFIPRRSWK